MADAKFLVAAVLVTGFTQTGLIAEMCLTLNCLFAGAEFKAKVYELGLIGSDVWTWISALGLMHLV